MSAATETFTILAATNQPPELTASIWFWDSGVSSYIFHNTGNFLNLTHSDAKIITADGRTHAATVLRDARLRVWLSNGTTHTVVLTRILYVPSFQYSLVSERRIDNIEVKIRVEKRKRSYEKDGKEFMTAGKENRLWKVVVAKDQALSISDGSIYEEKHQSLGHTSIIRNVYKDSPLLPVLRDFNCDTCNKQKSQNFVPPTVGICTKYHRDKIRFNLIGLCNTPGLRKNKHYMTFVNNYRRNCWKCL